MDRIGSNPSFNPTHLYQQNQTGKAQAPVENEVGKASNLSRSALQDTSQSTGYSSLFDDEELAKLQGNLEAIANLAERALKRIDS